MLGMHGTVVANHAVDEADLLLAIGVRFDDRVTGKLESFATRARIVHIDIDPAEISKNKEAHIPITSDSKPALRVCAVWCIKPGCEPDRNGCSSVAASLVESIVCRAALRPVRDLQSCMQYVLRFFGMSLS